MNLDVTESAAETNDVQTLTTTNRADVVVVPLAGPVTYRKNIFDTIQGSTSSHLVSLARWVDSFFDDPEYAEEEEADARVTLQQSVTFYRNLNPDFHTRVRASAVLPNLTRRFRLIFEGDDDLATEDTTGIAEDNLVESTRGSVDNPSVRLQYLLLKRRDVDLKLSGGVRLSESALYVGPRIKLRSNIGLGWEAKLTQRLYWYTTDNLKSKTEVRFDHLLGKRNLFRQSIRTDWDKEKYDDEGYRHTATSSLTQPLQQDSALRYAWSSVYDTRPDPGWTSTTLSVGYRRSIWRDWFIMEFAPFVTWEDQFDWDPKPGLSFSLSAIFEQD